MLSADGDIGNFGVTARTTRYGKVIALEATAPLAPNATSLTLLGPGRSVLSAKWITDLELRYKLMKRIIWRLGPTTCSMSIPIAGPLALAPRVGGSYPQQFQYIPYSGSSPFGFNGRFVYGRVSVDF